MTTKQSVRNTISMIIVIFSPSSSLLLARTSYDTSSAKERVTQIMLDSLLPAREQPVM